MKKIKMNFTSVAEKNSSLTMTVKTPFGIMKKSWKLQKKSVIGPKKDEPMEIWAMFTSQWVTFEKPLSIMKNDWKLQWKFVIEQEKE